MSKKKKKTKKNIVSTKSLKTRKKCFVYKVKKNFLDFLGGKMSGIEAISWHSTVKAQPVD